MADILSLMCKMCGNYIFDVLYIAKSYIMLMREGTVILIKTCLKLMIENKSLVMLKDAKIL